MLDIPDGGRVAARRSDKPVRIARVHATTFGDRLVAKFGLPVRGFRDSRHHAGPGHELATGPNVLTRDIVTRDIVTGDGTEPSVGEGSCAVTDDDE
jgi:NAD+ kinase